MDVGKLEGCWTDLWIRSQVDIYIITAVQHQSACTLLDPSVPQRSSAIEQCRSTKNVDRISRLDETHALLLTAPLPPSSRASCFKS